jgi:hypothetical protein
MLLEWLARRQDGRENFARAGQVIESAINTLVTDPVRRTGDLGGPLGTRAFTAALGWRISRPAARSAGCRRHCRTSGSSLRRWRP